MSRRRCVAEHPQTRSPLVRRTLASGLVGVALTASTLLGAGSAAASETVLVEQALAIVDATPGQQVAIAPSTMDSKVREAVLLAMPLDFDAAGQAAEQFAAQGPIMLGSVSEGNTFYSGGEIAEAAKSRISQLGLPEDRTGAVADHFGTLVSLGNAVTVRAEAEEPPPPPPEPEPEPTPPPDTTQPSPDTQPPSSPDNGGSASPYSGFLPNAVPGVYPQPGAAGPPNYAYTPGQLPAWAQSQFGQVPGMSPDVGSLLRQSQQQQRDKEHRDAVRAAGNAEAMPTEASKRVALPVLIAAISLAAVTAALVRTWVLRRQ